MRFRTVIQQDGNNTGIHVPDEIVAAFGKGRTPAVRVTLGGHTYRSTVAVLGGRSMISLSAANRAAAGVAGGDEVDVEVELDTAPRVVAVPDDLAAALAADADAQRTFDGLSNSNRGFWVSSVDGAKTPETRQRRIEKAVATLREGRSR